MNNTPSVLEPPVVQNALGVAQEPLFSKLDADSLSRAVGRYPASGGHHTIYLGDYIGAYLVRRLSMNSEIEHLSLQSMVIDCQQVGMLMPHVHCDGSIALEVTRDGQTQRVDGAITNFDVGNQIAAFGDPFGTPAGGDRVIANQVGRAAELPVDDVVSKIE